MNKPEQERVVKLPVWAQEYIHKLQNEVAELTRAANIADPEALLQARIVINPYSQVAPQVVDPQAMVAFRLGHSWVRIRRTDEDTLQINGDDGLCIYPWATNDVRLRMSGK
jgi:hypothetical protein